MWKPYLRVIAKKAGNALNILDRFHKKTYYDIVSRTGMFSQRDGSLVGICVQKNI